MALLEEELVDSDQGFKKKIDSNSIGLLMDMAQKGQYSKPIESTIREIASNAVDSQKERDIAKLILSGEKQVSDYFVEKEGEIYQASKFNPAYYDLNWLSDKPNILIEYFMREDEDRDLLRITDYGVGLGSYRLEGYMMLSYSTKRLNKNALGKFGIGGKAPLSTGVDYFTMKSNYNGEHTEFDIFLRKIDSLIPRYNTETEEENIKHEFSSESGNYIYYATPTLEKNSVSIEVEVKKHQRDAYKQAVVNQLLYFNNVDFFIYENYNEELKTGWIQQVPVTTQIYYESPNFLISKNNLYTRPHIVIGQPGSMVNYGLIDFAELELSPRTGNVGIILDSSEVDITPSRENVIWSNKTREQILEKFRLALEEANSVVNKELEDPDILKWIEKSISLLSDNGSNKIVSQLSGLIDRTQIISTYSLDSSFKYDSVPKLVGDYAKLRSVLRNSRYQNGESRVIIDRKELTSFKDINFTKLYFTVGDASSHKDAYVQHLEGGAFYLLTIPELSAKYWAEEEYGIYLVYKNIRHYTKEEMDSPAFKSGELFKDPTAGYFLADNKVWEDVEREIGKRIAEYNKSLKFLEFAKQSAYYHNYDEVVVPEGWKPNLYENQSVEELSDVTGLPKEAFNHAKRRKETGRIFLKYANFKRNNDNYHEHVDFEWKQKEEDLVDINNFQGTLIYTTQPDKEEMEKFPYELVENTEKEQLEDGSFPTMKVWKDSGNLDTDENLAKVVSYLLAGNIPGVYDLPNENTAHLKSNRGIFEDRNSNYSLYPHPIADPKTWNDHHASDIMLVKVAKPLAKKLTDFTPIREFVTSHNPETNTVSTHAKLMNWYTARRIATLIYSIPFLTNFSEISSYHAKEWRELYDLVRKHNITTNSAVNITNYPSSLHTKLVNDFDALADFQLYVREGNHTTEEIGAYSLEKLGATLSDALIIDMDIYNRAVKLVEWAAPIRDLLNNIPYFIKENTYSKVNETTKKDDFLDSIWNYLRSKSVEIIELQLPVVEKVLEVLGEDKDEEDEDDNYPQYEE